MIFYVIAGHTFIGDLTFMLSRISTETYSCENVLENDFQSRFSLVECFFLSEKAQKVEIFSTHWRREMFSQEM